MTLPYSESPEKKLSDLLLELLQIIKETGPMSEEVRTFVRQHKDVAEFTELAATIIYMVQQEKR